MDADFGNKLRSGFRESGRQSRKLVNYLLYYKHTSYG